MRAGAFAIALVLMVGLRASAQPGVPAIPPAPLATMLPPADQILPGGASVSQPLQPVDLPPAVLAPIENPTPSVRPWREAELSWSLWVDDSDVVQL